MAGVYICIPQYARGQLCSQRIQRVQHEYQISRYQSPYTYLRKSTRHQCRQLSRQIILKCQESDKTTSPLDPPNPGPSSSAGQNQPSSVAQGPRVPYIGNVPSTRRAIIGNLAAITLALGANFLGSTSFLLSLDGGEIANKLRLDVLYPVNGFKRYFENNYGVEFQYPDDWLADVTIARRRAADIQLLSGLDPPDPRELQRKQARDKAGIVGPLAAFGPAGTKGELNISLIVAKVPPTDRGLQSLGNPEEVATEFLTTTVAPEGSGRSARLIDSGQRLDGKQLYYFFEYEVESPKFQRHNVSITTVSKGNVFTLSAQCPISKWPDYSKELTKSALSLHVF